jgi:cytoskeletal protein CcmA (bactofilin family)
MADASAHTGIDSRLSVIGDITASEDMTLGGHIDGRVMMPDNHLTIASSARVKAAIVARSVAVAGTLDGSIVAGERVQLLPGAHVRGHLTTPSILLEDGATFTGTVDPQRTEAAMRVAKYREKQQEEAKPGA